MKLHVQIPHGCYVVNVRDDFAWTAIKLGFLLRNIPCVETPFQKKMLKNHPVIGEADLLLIGSTNPRNRLKLGEINRSLGLAA